MSDTSGEDIFLSEPKPSEDNTRENFVPIVESDCRVSPHHHDNIVPKCKLEAHKGDGEHESLDIQCCVEIHEGIEQHDSYMKLGILQRSRSFIKKEELHKQTSLSYARASGERRHSLCEADYSIHGVSLINSLKKCQNSESCKDLYLGDSSSQGQDKIENISHSPDLCAQYKNASFYEQHCKEKQRETRETHSSALCDQVQTHHLKWIYWHGKKTPIVTQNENGPCPLIAIANILLLRGIIKLPHDMAVITANQLLEFIGDTIMENMPKDLSGVSLLNYEQNMHDAIAILPYLHTGLNVNVKFTGVRDFEYTPECIIFDLLNIPLYHGWLVDPQCQETVVALGSLGYNQIVERIVVNKCSDNSELVTEALIAEQFLEGNATQLTYHGLCELNSTMTHEELAVLFRNNHFSTILKKKVCIPPVETTSQLLNIEELHELFQLVTDLGFLNESQVVWETLNNIEGDGQFVDGHFATVPPESSVTAYEPVPDVSQEQQIDHDFLVALSLQEDQKKEQDKEQVWEEFKQTLPGAQDITLDGELALRIQEDEHQVQNPPAQAQAGRHSSSLSAQLMTDRNKKGVCTVL